MHFIEQRAERRPATLPKTKPCTVTIIRCGRATTHTHDHIDGVAMAKAITRAKRKREGETRAARLLKRHDRLVDAELKLSKLFSKRK